MSERKWEPLNDEDKAEVERLREHHCTAGLYEKFKVERTDGQSEPGEKHHGCEYFVLDLDHDPHAIPALKAYAESCLDDYPQLAHDLKMKWLRLERPLQETNDHE